MPAFRFASYLFFVRRALCFCLLLSIGYQPEFSQLSTDFLIGYLSVSFRICIDLLLASTGYLNGICGYIVDPVVFYIVFMLVSTGFFRLFYRFPTVW